jgi:hypothetical protein
MKILCLFNEVHPLTRAAIEKYAPQTEYVDTSGSETAYWEAVRTNWNGTEDLMLIEHDVEIHAQVVPQFEACENLWCHFPYPYRGGLTNMATGCTRYRAEMQRIVSPEDILAEKSYRGVPGHWEYLDCTMANAFSKKGLGVCDHSPPVGHRGEHRACFPCSILNESQCLRGYPSADSCFYNIGPSNGDVLPMTVFSDVNHAPTWPRHPYKYLKMLYLDRKHRKVPVDAPLKGR